MPVPPSSPNTKSTSEYSLVLDKACSMKSVKSVDLHKVISDYLSVDQPSAQASASSVLPADSITSTPKSSRTESRRESLLPAGRVNLPKKNGSISASNTSLSSAAMVIVLTASLSPC